jgi:hypothetical protein
MYSSILNLNSHNKLSINSKTYDTIKEFLDYREPIYKNAIQYLDKHVFTGNPEVHREIVFYTLVLIVFSCRYGLGDIKFKLNYLNSKSRLENINNVLQKLMIEEIMKINSTFEHTYDTLLFELIKVYNFSYKMDTLFKYPKYLSTLGFYFLSCKTLTFISDSESSLKEQTDDKLYDSEDIENKEETEVVNVADDDDEEYSLAHSSVCNDYEVDMELTMYEYEMFTKLENKLTKDFYMDSIKNTMDHKSYLTYVLKSKNGVDKLKEYLNAEMTDKEEYKVKNYQNWLLR